MAAVVIEVPAVIAAVAGRATRPAMGPPVATAAGAASEAAPPQPGEGLGDGFGGIVRFGRHVSILHAT
ncbi:hypothetical protein RS85_00745 [Microbacterium sp. SA39]|nr:hypothetical protein RS85_00745 [Microbacterium sp. SA39]